MGLRFTENFVGVFLMLMFTLIIAGLITNITYLIGAGFISGVLALFKWIVRIKRGGRD